MPVLIVLLMVGAAVFDILGGGSDIDYEIPQNIGGSLIVAGQAWMDFHSFGDITTVHYRPKDSMAQFPVGGSDYYGRDFDKSKQIIERNGVFMVSLGDRLEGDKLAASRDLKKWTEFTFSRDSILAIESQDNRIYLADVYPDNIFLNRDLQTAEWIRRTRYGSDRIARKVSFTFTLDWNRNQLVAERIVDVVVDAKF